VPLTPRLRSLITKFKRQFGKANAAAPLSSDAAANHLEGVETILKRVRMPALSLVNIHQAPNLFGFFNRTVGVESMYFLESVISVLKPHMMVLLPKAREKNVLDFFAEVEAIPDLARYCYRRLGMRQLEWEEFVGQVANTRWDIKEVGIEHSAYVDWIMNHLTRFGKIVQLEMKTYAIPARPITMLWEELIRHAMEQLVEGYSRAKKCTNEGRTIMLLDLKMFQNSLENICNIRPIPQTQYVEGYIKAFYLTENDILEWCKAHPEYSLKQLLALVNVGVGQLMKKKPKQDLIAALEELDKQRRMQASTLK